ncbi:hypothetical protein H6F76_03220 [Leptolyngbya sp. FACHB-321]|uniref:hypothetical protein n=1 Tax=Leptolyngbya sp. FACHB-321 TaxID=2692807 RepID=UPI001682DDAA|nr:hypothetical protein [Leptolyngbya sp. FACHB-321]MBD2034061.1 hypothetical protein [Leptolyngbya sp. FACHB-321]
MTSSSSRRTSRPKPPESDETSLVPEIEAYSDLSDVTANVSAMPSRQVHVDPPAIPELDAPETISGTGNRRQPYVNALMPVMRRIKRQPPSEVPEAEMNALYGFLGDETGEVRVNSAFLSEAFTFFAGELFERYSRTSLTLAIYLGKNGGMGVSAAKREISRATGVVIGESDINGFPRHLGLRYTPQQLTDAVAYLNEGYGENGSIVPGAITAANEALRQKNEAAGRTNRY